ncbi:MAG: hypothetical protein COX79_04580 [Candidatus Levybacteria bacterium CG_4_10_14_0_2_um_filter_36_16]|nr:MAG: hypothetical protein AUK12_03025 [Candidatus Levybacteria bacterium CG2_30_37_29]PIR79624.1 MAG: hypothetical protein COU26_00120 [Candidatus Levybacteria bacterium CG10_big_fil_rev_8_21_14_0_10_36_30]PIZ96710.1 MAG: hypothetical protein COX79_04580 [Candidatus Levybacteria bacterium CG_4_10_14_0_2_um_filter_36_16]PJA90298.1 MAG: hypothetical protein CO136_02575 [Candidatus Levybacteria bacterium CG_4_9_14_3_um_filter_36_7]
MKQRIVFFGSGYYVIPIVEKLRQHNLQLVVTTEVEGKFVTYLEKNNIPFIQSRLKEKIDIEKIEQLKPTLGILASYGAIIPKKIISIFPLGIFNIHPSLLPKYKGPSPVQFTILNGDKKSGTTIIKLDDKVDHGPILGQIEMSLNGDETMLVLTEKLFFLGASLIEKIIQKLEKGTEFQEIPQDHKKELWTQKIEKKDGSIDLNKLPNSEDLDRKIRAFFPWPGIYLTASLGGEKKLIKLFPQKKIQVEGKNAVSYKDFINGYGKDAKNVLEKLKLT